MTTVFYWTTQGAPGARPIYGLHPSGQPVKGGVPDGIARFDVAAPPSGVEHTHVVDDTATPPALALKPAVVSKEQLAKDAIAAALASKKPDDILAALAAVSEVL